MKGEGNRGKGGGEGKFKVGYYPENPLGSHLKEGNMRRMEKKS